MRLNLTLLTLLAGTALYIYSLRRQLRAEQIRGNMYREISARLDRRVVELTAS